MKSTRRILLILLHFFFVVSPTHAQTTDGITLLTLENKNFPLAEWKKNKFTAVVFLLADCPACQSYSLTLNKLSSQFSDCGVKFYGVFPGEYGSVEEDIQFRNDYRINFPLLRDPDKILVTRLHAKVSPEVFVLDAERRIIYRGRIDDWMYAVGKKRVKITSHDLKLALTAACMGNTIKNPLTQAIGCIIE
ncbi:MAG TPA: redoxin domain-containing protein [Bacteroidia bacterium]|nr:redoxin domain-containing protein [Bacteroidia bacterium]